MKLSVSTLTCPDWPLERIIAAAAEFHLAGIDFRGLGAEIDVTQLIAFTIQLNKTLCALHAARLSIPCFQTSVTLLAPVGPRWEAMMNECHRYAVLAGQTKTPMLRIFGGEAPRGIGGDEALALARRRLRQVVKICRIHGCRPLVETHDAWSAAGEIMMLLQGFTAEEVGVLWDVEHPFRCGESPSQTVGRLGPYLSHVHIKDSVRETSRSRPTLLGEGQLPISDCLRALKSCGYTGWICLETEKRWHADAPAPEQSIPQFAAYMRNGGGS